MRAPALAFALVLAAGCASMDSQSPLAETPLDVRPTGPTEPLVQPTPEAPFDPHAFMNGMLTPGECADAARDMHARHADRGRQALKACIEKGHFPRADFTDLRPVLDGTWNHDLETRPDAAITIAKLIALRGGDVDGDLAKFLAVRAPVFSLAAAIAQPETYKGRYVLMRAEVGGEKGKADLATTRFVETSLASQMKQAEVEGRHYASTSQSSTSYHARYRSSNYGSGRGTLGVDRSSSSRSTEVNVRYENQAVPTGRVALGRLAKPDPFLESGKEYVVLGRFEGVRRSPDDADDAPPAALVTVVAYFVPNALLID